MFSVCLGLTSTKNLHLSKGLACIIAVAIVLLIPVAGSASTQLRLGLDGSDSGNIKGYRIYCKTGTAGEPYNGCGLTNGNEPWDVPAAGLPDPAHAVVTINGLEAGELYRFVATVYDGNGNESKYCSEVVYETPAPLILTYQISASASGNGTITPTGTSTVAYGESLTYQINPAPGHHIANVVVDGRNVGQEATYTFADIDNDHNIAVSFAADTNSAPSSNDGNNTYPLETAGPKFETRTVRINHDWSRVLFEKQFTRPVVIAGPLSLHGHDPAVVRIRNVDATGFEIRIQEWSYLDDWHTNETVSYMVIEQGTYQLRNGARLEAGHFRANDAVNHQPVSFGQTYAAPPVVMTSISTYAGQAPVTDRIDNITRSGFEYRLQEEEASDHVHATETIGYLAWEASSGVVDGMEYRVGRTASTVTDQFHNIMFPDAFDAAPVFLANIQTTHGGDPANLRYNNLDGFSVDVLIHEEQSMTEEIIHTNEVVGYMVMHPAQDSDNDGLIDADEIHFGTNPQIADSDGDGINDAAELAYWAERWNEDSDKDGVINLLDADSDNDGVNDGDEISKGTDPCVYNTNPQKPRLEVGQLKLNHEWTRVPFEKKYTRPVVVAGPISLHGHDPAVVRIRNVDATGFEIRIQEWSYLDDWHTNETVSYMVIEQGTYQLGNGARLEAGHFRANDAVNHQPVSFGQTYAAPPVVMTSITTYAGQAPVTDRIDNITRSGFEYRLQEEEASDHVHATETIGYLAWETSSGVVDGMEYRVGRTASTVTDQYHNIMFPDSLDAAPVFLSNIQTTHGGDPANLRYNNLDGYSVDVLIHEEQSMTEEIIHTNEVVGYMVMGQ